MYHGTPQYLSFIIFKYSSSLRKKNGVYFYCLLYGFEFQILVVLDWLSNKFRVASSSGCLTHGRVSLTIVFWNANNSSNEKVTV